MEIKDEHIEFAVVQRFSEMLHEPHTRYEVSSVYAVFVAILCWSTQRLRTDTSKDSSPEARAAANVWAELVREPISLAPWKIAIADDALAAGENLRGDCLASPDFQGHTADRLIKNLRDAAAHGDGRKVEPQHTGIRNKPERTLAGFKFKCEERNRQGKVAWTGEIILLKDAMVRIADEIARRFCATMEQASKYSYLKEDAAVGVKEAA